MASRVDARGLRRRRARAGVTVAAAIGLVAGLHMAPAAAAAGPTSTRVTAAAPSTTTALPASRTAAGPAEGYRTFGADGGVFDYGTNRYLGNVYTDHIRPSAPIVGLAPTFDGEGYWLVGKDGGVLSFGDAVFHGSAGNLHLAAPVVGTAATPDGRGYWLVGADGGVFAYGDAGFYGSAGNLHLTKPIVGMASTPDGKGYWLVASDGGVFAYGDATFFGSLGNLHLTSPIVGIAGPATGEGTTPSGEGYLLVGGDGGVFAYGALHYAGSLPGSGTAVRDAVGITATPDDQGYWIATADGGVTAYGDATFLGDHATDVAAHLSPPGLLGPWVGITSIPPPGDTTTPPPPPATLTYVVNSGTPITELADPKARRAAARSAAQRDQEGDPPSVTVFAAGATGAATPVATIQGPDTGLEDPFGVVVNAAGDVFVSNDGEFLAAADPAAARPAIDPTGPSITEYAPGATGDATPIAVISGTDTDLADPLGIALDAAGDLFVADDGAVTDNGAVLEFAAGANGDVAPTATLSGDDADIAEPDGVVIGSDGTIYVANYDGDDGSGNVTEYPAGSHGSPAPSGFISDSEDFDGVDSVALDTSDHVYVTTANGAAVLEFTSSNTNGADIAPARNISGAATGLNEPEGVAVDASGDVYASNNDGDTVTEYGPTADGNAAPMATNSSDMLDGPLGLAQGPG